MTRFQQEISGALGQWWKEQVEKELEDAVRKADADATVIGVITGNVIELWGGGTYEESISKSKRIL